MLNAKKMGTFNELSFESETGRNLVSRIDIFSIHACFSSSVHNSVFGKNGKNLVSKKSAAGAESAQRSAAQVCYVVG